MPLIFNIRHLEKKPIVLTGELAGEELDLADVDELIQVPHPLKHDLTLEKKGLNILVNGQLEILLDCECARCLASYQHLIDLPDWTCLLPLEGEEKVEIKGDFVDLTPFLREDILLAFPQHPLCKPECGGLTSMGAGKTSETGVEPKGQPPSAWAELDKLKF